MRILVSGARGKVGSATVSALHDAGHDVTATDRTAPLFEAQREAVAYLQAGVRAALGTYATASGRTSSAPNSGIPRSGRRSASGG